MVLVLALLQSVKNTKQWKIEQRQCVILIGTYGKIEQRQRTGFSIVSNDLFVSGICHLIGTYGGIQKARQVSINQTKTYLQVYFPLSEFLTHGKHHALLIICVAGHIDGTNVDEYNTNIIPVDENVDDTYSMDPGISLCEHGLHTLSPIDDTYSLAY